MVPENPKSISAKISSTHTGISVTWLNVNEVGKPYDGIHLLRQTNGGALELIADLSKSSMAYFDSSVSPGNTYRYAPHPYNSEGENPKYAYSNSVYFIPEKPAAPSSVASSRQSDYQNKVTWSPNPTPLKPVDSNRIYRSTDGGAFALIATVNGTLASYYDSSTSPNHSYRYAVSSGNEGGWSDLVYTGTTYNTPCAPGKPSGARTTGSKIALSFANDANTATATEIQRSSDRSSWTTIATTSGKATGYTDAAIDGYSYYRARNTRGSLVSAWSPISDAVVSPCPPAAPTLVAPASGSPLLKSSTQIEFSWRHNPIDGSSQTAAQLQYSTDAANWATVDVSTAQSVAVANQFALNATVYWRVRTKGVFDGWGPWSANRSFSVRQSPQIAITSPGPVIVNLPIDVAIQYVDASGTLAQATAVFKRPDGTTAATVDMGASTSAMVPKGTFAPENGVTYTLEVTARSTSGLQNSQSLQFTPSFEPPKRVSAHVTPDLDRGWATLRVIVDKTGDGQEVAEIDVWRVVDGDEALIASSVSDGDSIVDTDAPLNVEYAYKVISYATSGASRTYRHEGSIKTPFCFFYYGDGGIARAQFDPEEPRHYSRPGRTLVRYAGRKYPVLYDSGGVEETRTMRAHLMGADEIGPFDELCDHSRCFFKSVAGDAFCAAVGVEVSPQLAMATPHADVSVTITRIEESAR